MSAKPQLPRPLAPPVPGPEVPAPSRPVADTSSPEPRPTDETAGWRPAASPLRPSRARQRRIGLVAVSLTVVLCGIAYWAWWTHVGRFYVSTDNAYVQGNLVQLTPQVAGTVVAINVDDTDRVQAGQPLVLLDNADAQVALEQAQAQLAQAVREVQSTYTNNGTFRANIALREADVLRSRAELARALDDARRREGLLATGAVSGEEMQHARAALDAARSTLVAAQAAAQAAREQLAANLALTAGTPVEEHPNVQRAAARVREALLAVRRSTLPAPVSGHVAKRSVQVGQRVQPGQPLMSVIPLDQVWVEANFKEGQLRDMRIGQPVALTADLYGSRVTYRGRIVGLGAGTGSAFALLPAQNATGNWIKVVQRLPVRVELDPSELAQHPLRVGLSMEAEVDIRDRSGPSLAEAPRRESVARTQAFDSDVREADEVVRRIIAANLARADASVGAATVPSRTPRAAGAAQEPPRSRGAASAPQVPSRSSRAAVATSGRDPR